MLGPCRKRLVGGHFDGQLHLLVHAGPEKRTKRGDVTTGHAMGEGDRQHPLSTKHKRQEDKHCDKGQDM